MSQRHSLLAIVLALLFLTIALSIAGGFLWFVAWVWGYDWGKAAFTVAAFVWLDLYSRQVKASLEKLESGGVVQRTLRLIRGGKADG